MAMTLTGSPQITAAALDAAINTELATNWMPLAGVTTNSNAAAGTIGEYISSTVLNGAPITLSTGTGAALTSISLTAGDWDVNGNVGFSTAVTATSIGSLVAVLSLTSAVAGGIPASGGYGAVVSAGSTLGGGTCVCVGPMRFSLASTTTVFINTSSIFSGGAVSVCGFIGARRAR